MQALQTVLPCKMRGRVTLCILSSIEPVRNKNISPAAPPTLTHAGTSCVPAPQPPHTGRSCCLTDPLLATQTTLRRAPLPYPTTHQATHQAPYVAARGASTHPRSAQNPNGLQRPGRSLVAVARVGRVGRLCEACVRREEGVRGTHPRAALPHGASLTHRLSVDDDDRGARLAVREVGEDGCRCGGDLVEQLGALADVVVARLLGAEDQQPEHKQRACTPPAQGRSSRGGRGGRARGRAPTAAPASCAIQ